MTRRAAVKWVAMYRVSVEYLSYAAAHASRYGIYVGLPTMLHTFFYKTDNGTLYRRESTGTVITFSVVPSNAIENAALVTKLEALALGYPLPPNLSKKVNPRPTPKMKFRNTAPKR